MPSCAPAFDDTKARHLAGSSNIGQVLGVQRAEQRFLIAASSHLNTAALMIAKAGSGQPTQRVDGVLENVVAELIDTINATNQRRWWLQALPIEHKCIRRTSRLIGCRSRRERRRVGCIVSKYCHFHCYSTFILVYYYCAMAFRRSSATADIDAKDEATLAQAGYEVQLRKHHTNALYRCLP